MEKKGQVTLFIVIGMILVLMFFLLIFFYDPAQTVEESEPADFMGLENFIVNCLEESMLDAIYDVSNQGGWMYFPDNHVTYERTSTRDVSVALDFTRDDENVSLDLDEIRNNIETLSENNILFCVDDFNEYKQRGFNVSYGEPDVDLEIQDVRVIFDVDFPVNATFMGSRHSLSNFGSFRYPLMLGNFYNVYTFINEFVMDDQSQIPLNSLDFVNPMGITFHIHIESDVNSVIYHIVDYNDEIGTERYIQGGKFRYVFAHKFE